MKPLPVYSRTVRSGKEDKSAPVPFINYNETAPKRCLAMLLAKFNGDEYQTEVNMRAPAEVEMPALQIPLEQARLLLITDGGLVPAGNPDQLPPTNASRFGVYFFGRCSSLEAAAYEISHQGYDHRDVDENPNRLLPVDILVQLAQDGVIRELYPYFISTTGVMIASEKAKRMGSRIAAFVQNRPVDAAIIVSTCATSTRCGSYIGLALERAGIPVVQITNLTAVASNTGMHRVVKGASVGCPIGNAKFSPENERQIRKGIVMEALKALTDS